MQLGFVWLGKMGVKVVRRIQRHSDHTVITFDVDPDAVRPRRAMVRSAPVAGRVRAPAGRVDTLMALPACSCRHPLVGGLEGPSGRNALASGITPSTMTSETPERLDGR
jgi:hypothetical protein